MPAKSRLGKTIGKNLKIARKARGLTQVELAQKIGVTPNHYARLERGESLPAMNTLEAVSKALRIHSSDLLPF